MADATIVSSDEDVARVLAADKAAGRVDPYASAPPPDTTGAFDWGSAGQVNRAAIAQELQDKPWLHDRLKQMVRGEVGNSASDEVRRIQLETVMNRALVRGHSLEQGLWDTGQYGNRGYYPPQTFSRGPYNHDTYVGDLNTVLGGSNYGGKYLPAGHLVTGNASADVAAHQFQRGTPGFTLQTGSGPESYFNQDQRRSAAMAGLFGPGPTGTPVVPPAPTAVASAPRPAIPAPNAVALAQAQPPSKPFFAAAAQAPAAPAAPQQAPAAMADALAQQGQGLLAPKMPPAAAPLKMQLPPAFRPRIPQLPNTLATLKPTLFFPRG